MPRLEAVESGYDMSSSCTAAIPYKWEVAPGKPLTEAAPAASEPRRTPLRPPPGSSGIRGPISFIEPTFNGFEPEGEALKPSGQYLAEKIFKKILKLRKKSLVVAACFSLDNLRAATEQSKRFTILNADRSYDSDEYSRSFASTSDQPDTPTSSTSSRSSLGFSSSGSLSDGSGHAFLASNVTQPGSHVMANMLMSLSLSDDDDDDENDDRNKDDGHNQIDWRG